ncbi:galaxin-like isoform X2 [Carassius gibelio]|uniref:galaxin-like isoform X2 n=1 Tax=Carassius gibelio TaxID=101364 RepID=UPI0022791EFA|nr:galaxin-like isoform X2 [Carassius gibelio]
MRGGAKVYFGLHKFSSLGYSSFIDQGYTMEFYTSALCLVLYSFATSSAKEILHHDRGTHNARFNEQMESISKNHLHWCGNVSYKISGSTCCNGNITPGLSQLVADCCGSVAYNPLNEICCNDNILTRSSTYEKCCGEDLYLTTTHMCCGSNNIFKQKENLSCCGNTTFDKTTHCCCFITRNNALEAMPKNETCCPKATERQQAPLPIHTLPKLSDLKCGSKTYNPHKQMCCSGNLYMASPLTKCCGEHVYTLSDDSVLCCNGVLHRNVPEQSECVGGVIYTPANTTCQMSTRPRLGEHCCGGQTFNPRTQICCNGRSHNKMNGNFCCGSEVYDHNNQFLRCCSGHLYNLTQSRGKAECCGNLLLQYNNNQTCCSSSTNSIIYQTKPKHRCCGLYYYNTSLWSCCAEHLKPTPKPNSSPAEYRIKPLMDLIPEMCNKTVLFGKVESVALENDLRHVVLKVVWQVDMKSENVIKDPWLHVSLDHCNSPTTDNGMTYLWEENHNGKYKLLSHPVDLTSDIYMFYSVCYQKKG